jgi:hypothetical protein
MSKLSAVQLAANALATLALVGAVQLSAQERPRVSTGRHGELEVTFANDCHVRYDAAGTYQGQSDQCSRDQEHEASEAINRYLREQGSSEATPSHQRHEASSGWTAGSSNRVYQNIDARASGSGRTDLAGIKGNGAFSAVRARIGTSGDAIIDVADPTDGQIRARVESVEGRTLRLAVTAVYGYRASGSMVVELVDDHTVRALSGSGSGEHGQWSLNFPVRR